MSWNIAALMSHGEVGEEESGEGRGAETQLVEAELQLDGSMESQWGRGKQRI